MMHGCATEVSTLLLRPELFGSVDRYILMSRYGRVAVDVDMPYDKRVKATHRFTIADTRGAVNVTVPTVHPSKHHGTLVSDILLSDHSPWWQTVMTALESAYGRTPFFEFYADDFARLFTSRRVGTPLVDFCRDADLTVCRLIGLDMPAYVGVEAVASAVAAGGMTDRRRGVPEVSDFTPYYQVRAEKLGFLPHLSIVDLLFNLGSEALLYLEGSL